MSLTVAESIVQDKVVLVERVSPEPFVACSACGHFPCPMCGPDRCDEGMSVPGLTEEQEVALSAEEYEARIESCDCDGCVYPEDGLVQNERVFSWHEQVYEMLRAGGIGTTMVDAKGTTTSTSTDDLGRLTVKVTAP